MGMVYEENEETTYDEEDIYNRQVREELLNNDEIGAEEAGFMQGYEET